MFTYNEFITEVFSKEEEIERAKDSDLLSANHRGFHVEVTPHGGSQEQIDNRKNLRKGQWDDFKGRMVDELRDKPNGHYSVYSKNKYNQAVIVQHIPEEKRIKIMTVLPKGRYHPRYANTDLHIMESFKHLNLTYIFLD